MDGLTKCESCKSAGLDVHRIDVCGECCPTCSPRPFGVRNPRREDSLAYITAGCFAALCLAAAWALIMWTSGNMGGPG